MGFFDKLLGESEQRSGIWVYLGLQKLKSLLMPL